MIPGAILAMASFVFSGCEKDNGSLGLDQVVGSKDAIGLYEDFPIIAYTREDDSVRTGQPARLLVGDVYDPRFGRTRARFGMQMILEKVSPDFGANAVLDSAFLMLDYTGFYGDTAGIFSVEVKRLETELTRDTIYYSNHPVSTGLSLGTHSFTPRPSGTSRVDGDTISAVLRIPLDAAAIEDIIFTPGRLGNYAFADNNDFVKYFNGVTVEATAPTGCFLYFSPTALFTRLVMYYHNDEDTAQFSLIVNTSTANLNLYEHDYNLAEFNLDMQDSVNGESLLYAQAMGGVYTLIRIPELAALKDSAYLINKAELILPVEQGSAGEFKTVPSTMLITTIEDDGEKVLLRDYASSEGGRIGGLLDKGDYRQKEYVFNITRHIAAAIADTAVNRPLALVAASTASTSNQVVFNGNSNPDRGVRLRIYYTKVKN